MKIPKLAKAMENIDDELVSGAAAETKKKKKRGWARWGSIAAILVVCISIGVFGIGSPGIFIGADSVITLDVNPSISLTVNTNEKIVDAEGLNEDGVTVLDDMDLEGVDMDVAVNAVIGSMLQKGYLNDLQNVVLVSVENTDEEKSAELQEQISSVINSAFQNGNLDGAVLSQSVDDTDELEQIAREYGISLGKAALIQEVIAQDSTLTVEELAPLSITEIALISQSRDVIVGTVTQDGTVSAKAYISQEQALESAYSYAGVNAEDVLKVETELDSDDGIMIYEIEFRTETGKYECSIDARTGQILEFETNTEDQSSQNSGEGTGGQYIGEDAAKTAALSDAGTTAGNVKYVNAWLEYDDGSPSYYKVEFEANSVKYKYNIDMYSGEVLGKWIEDYGSQSNHKHG